MCWTRHKGVMLDSWCDFRRLCSECVTGFLTDESQYSVCVCKHLDLHIWCESHTHTHPGHLSPWKLALLRLISIQTVTPGKQTSPASRASTQTLTGVETILWLICRIILGRSRRRSAGRSSRLWWRDFRFRSVRCGVSKTLNGAERRLRRQDKQRWRPSFSRQQADDFIYGGRSER